jgi:hypothetical protein
LLNATVNVIGMTWNGMIWSCISMWGVNDVRLIGHG